MKICVYYQGEGASKYAWDIFGITTELNGPVWPCVLPVDPEQSARIWSSGRAVCCEDKAMRHLDNWIGDMAIGSKVSLSFIWEGDNEK